MKRIFVILFHFNLLWLAGLGQSQPVKIEATPESERYWSAWHKELYDVGIRMDKDSLYVSEESKKIIMDSGYRKNIYPANYSWQETILLLKKLELKKAFWYLTNLYQTDTAHRQLVVESIVSYDQLVETDKILISSFYTYALLDPKVSKIKNGKPEILRPDLLEKKFAHMKEIVNYILAYRKTKPKSK